MSTSGDISQEQDTDMPSDHEVDQDDDVIVIVIENNNNDERARQLAHTTARHFAWDTIQSNEANMGLLR